MSDHILDENVEQFNEEYRYAGFWTRVGASIVDMLVFIPLIGLSMYILLVLKSLPLILVITLIMAVYKPLMEYQYGATLGKMAMGIKVINDDGGMLTPNQAIIRYSPWLISNIINVLFTIEMFGLGSFEEVSGFMEYIAFTQEYSSTLTMLNSIAGWLVILSVLVLLFNKQKQAFHDKIAKTYCIHKD